MADEKDTNAPVSDPDDDENIVIDTTSTEPLRNAKIEEPAESDEDSDSIGNFRRKFIAPGFGSAGSGGAELEPGPDGDPSRA